MATFFVLYDPSTRSFVRSGTGNFRTYSLNYAKHFTSEWSANNCRAKYDEMECLIVKKICIQ